MLSNKGVIYIYIYIWLLVYIYNIDALLWINWMFMGLIKYFNFETQIISMCL